jgi:murein DD-endopeptidase MepM/ murein hydrolase activator NlpD
MRSCWLVLAAVLATGCPPPEPAYGPHLLRPRTAPQPRRLGALDDRLIDFQFDGGQIEFELYRQGTRITQVARNRYAVPLMIRWTLLSLENVEPASPTEGVAFLPAARTPLGLGPTIVLAELALIDRARPYSRQLHFRARFGDPRARPDPYVYRLPYPTGLTFSVLQGFRGTFSHTGSNEFAVDFDCPVATTVLATRPGTVVVVNAAAQGSGTTAEYLDYRRTNFILIRHDDDTLGEYMHLSPSGIEVAPGQRVTRGHVLGLSGNTGFSSTPHLHFGVITAGLDGVSARTFPFQLAAAPGRVEAPVQGQRYSAWE